MDKLKSEIFQALGGASMCWTETPTGVFDSQQAVDIGEELYSKIAESQFELRARLHAAVSLLAKHQWQKRDFGDTGDPVLVCPECEWFKTHGHWNRCDLARLLQQENEE